MATSTSIEWVRGADGSAGLSWNALRAEREIVRKGARVTVSAHHCEHVNEACRWCYADRTNARLGGLPFKPGHRKDYRFVIDRDKLLAPLKRRKPTRIFVESMSDAFGDWWPRNFVDQLYAVMALTPQHIYINLSKRPARRRQYLDDPETPKRIANEGVSIIGAMTLQRADTRGYVQGADHGQPGERLYRNTLTAWPLPNVIEGTSVSDQPEADEFVPILLRTKATLRIVSAEPLLEPIDLTNHCNGHYFFDSLRGTRWHDDPDHANPAEKYLPGLDGVIAGGESGPRARIMHPDLPRTLRDQCADAGIPFFFKQWGAWAPPDQVPQESWTHVHDYVGGQYVVRIKKKKAGRAMLDGVVHDGFPVVRS
jgi:protein gp37